MTPFRPSWEAPNRILMGPGPSDVPPSVLAALAKPTIGHLDPAFLALLDEVREMLRVVLATQNELTLPMSGTGSAGMETCITNLVEPGDAVLVGANGVFGERLQEVARRAGAEVTAVDHPWGTPLDAKRMREAAAGKRFKLVCMVHAETSTGVLSPIAPIRALADELGALLLVDAVTSLGGVPVDMDAQRIDALYSGTQKCLSCPPGLAPVSFSERAEQAIAARSRKAQSWYLDLSLIGRYWSGERMYHHTAPTNMLVALHEALRLALNEGLRARYARHALHGKALARGLTALGLVLPVAEDVRMPQLTLVEIPSGVDDAAARRALLETYGIEIGGGLGVFKGKAWRIGLMGASATRRHVTLCLAALKDVLVRQGVRARGDGVAAADEIYASASS